jgi:hypothetical protein
MYPALHPFYPAASVPYNFFLLLCDVYPFYFHTTDVPAAKFF